MENVRNRDVAGGKTWKDPNGKDKTWLKLISWAYPPSRGQLIPSRSVNQSRECKAYGQKFVCWLKSPLAFFQYIILSIYIYILASLTNPIHKNMLNLLESAKWFCTWIMDSVHGLWMIMITVFVPLRVYLAYIAYWRSQHHISIELHSHVLTWFGNCLNEYCWSHAQRDDRCESRILQSLAECLDSASLKEIHVSLTHSKVGQDIVTHDKSSSKLSFSTFPIGNSRLWPASIDMATSS